MRENILKSILLMPQAIRMSTLLENRKYRKLEEICLNGIDKRSDKLIYIFYLFYLNAYQNKYTEADSYYWQLKAIRTTSKKTRHYYINHVIDFQVRTKLYTLAVTNCKKLLEDEKDELLKVSLLRCLCKVNYCQKKFTEVIKLCSQLEDYSDSQTIKFRNLYLVALKEKGLIPQDSE